jgi:hypothetical protein
MAIGLSTWHISIEMGWAPLDHCAQSKEKVSLIAKRTISVEMNKETIVPNILLECGTYYGTIIVLNSVECFTFFLIGLMPYSYNLVHPYVLFLT